MLKFNMKVKERKNLYCMIKIQREKNIELYCRIKVRKKNIKLYCKIKNKLYLMIIM